MWTLYRFEESVMRDQFLYTKKELNHQFTSISENRKKTTLLLLVPLLCIFFLSPLLSLGSSDRSHNDYPLIEYGAEAQGAYSSPWGSLSHTCDKLFR